jgi:hypothetical protein
MQEIVRLCDMPVNQKGGGSAPHGQKVTGEPTQFSVGGTGYEVDLCVTHRSEFDKALAPFIEAASPISRTGTAVRKALKGKKGGFTTKDVRKWLSEQGREVAPSGRLPNELIEEYKTAHSA